MRDCLKVMLHAPLGYQLASRAIIQIEALCASTLTQLKDLSQWTDRVTANCHDLYLLIITRPHAPGSLASSCFSLTSCFFSMARKIWSITATNSCRPRDSQPRSQ